MSSMAGPGSVCSQESLAVEEPLTATASRAEHWLLVEYRGTWPRDPIDGGLPEPVRAHLGEQLASLGSAKLLYVRRPDARDRGPYRVFTARSTEGGASLRAFEVEAYEELLELDLAAPAGHPVAGPLVLVCAHGKRDPCCARFGPAAYEELRRGPLGDGVWQSSHLGGHRFAANVVLLPDGLMFGRVTPSAAAALAARFGDREILLLHYRGRCSYPPAAQAAERALREREGLLGIDDIELAGAESDGEVTRVHLRIRSSGDVRELEVGEEEGPALPLSCGDPPEPTRRLEVG